MPQAWPGRLSPAWIGAVGLLAGFAVVHPLAVLARALLAGGEAGQAVMDAFRLEWAVGLLVGVAVGLVAWATAHLTGRAWWPVLRRAEQEGEALRQRLVEEREAAVRALAEGVAKDVDATLDVIGEALGGLDAALPAKQAARLHLRGAKAARKEAAELPRRLRMFVHRTDYEEDLDLQAEVQAARTRLEGLVGKDVHIQIEAHLVPPVRMNRAEWEEVLEALATNAREAMPDGGTLRIGVQASGGAVVVKVDDTGAGMTADGMREALQPAFTTRRGGGTGLGLALVQRIVERHGGSVECRSAPGKGTLVKVRLPAARVAPGAGAPSKPG